MNILGKRLKKLRESKGLNQKNLAKILNVSNTTLSQYESGQRIPGDDIKIKIAEYFEVSIDYLLGRTEQDKLKNIDKLAHKEINTVEDALEIIESQEGLMLKGELLTDEDKLLLANALQLGMKYVLDKKQQGKG